jgi:hypothetical protein
MNRQRNGRKMHAHTHTHTSKPVYDTKDVILLRNPRVHTEKLLQIEDIIIKMTRNVRVKVTLRRVRVSNVAVEKQCVLHFGSVCFCSLNYPTRQAHAPCYVVTCGLSGSTIYFHVIG